MFALRSGRYGQDALWQHTIRKISTGQCLRSFSGRSPETQKIKEDLPIKMENPYKEPAKGCILCNIKVDFKNVQLLSQFVSPHTGRIYGRHITGLCGQKQREVSKAIKKAHHMGFMSVTLKDPAFLKDPNICNIKHFE